MSAAGLGPAQRVTQWLFNPYKGHGWALRMSALATSLGLSTLLSYTYTEELCPFCILCQLFPTVGLKVSEGIGSHVQTPCVSHLSTVSGSVV